MFTHLKKVVLLIALVLSGSLIYGQSVLCVDRDGSFYSESFTDVWPKYQEVLDALGITYDYFEVEDPANNGPDATTMNPYDIVLWFTGETWEESQTMTNDDEFNLLLYTSVSGGKLLLSAQDYLWDRYSSAGVFSSGTFPYDILGLREVSQDMWLVDMPDTIVVAGAQASCIEGMLFGVEDLFTEETREGLFIDQIVDHAGENMFEMSYASSDSISAIQYDGGNYRAIFSTTSVACIIRPEMRKNIMENMFAWLMGTIGTDEYAISATQEMLVYPNPAKDQVSIGTDENIDFLVIYNTMGQEVYRSEVGDYKIKVNISDLEKGMYLINAGTASGLKSSKMLVE